MKLKSIFAAAVVLAFAALSFSAPPQATIDRPPQDSLVAAKLTVAEKYLAAYGDAVEHNRLLVTFIGCKPGYWSHDNCVVAHCNTMVGHDAPCVVISAPHGGVLYDVATVENDAAAILAALPKKRTMMVDCESGTCRPVSTYFPTCEGGTCSGPASCGASGNCSTCSACQAARQATGRQRSQSVECSR
jgi:hypothetical protein